MTRSLLRRPLTAHPGDWLWGAIGVSMASVSATFACYQIATAPSKVTGYGVKGFNVFVAFDKRAPTEREVAAAAAARPATLATAAPGPTPPPPPERIARGAVDPEPTGSIPAPPQTTAIPRSGALRDYRVRDVFGTHALIEHGRQLSVVSQGSILAGAGAVRSIEHQDSGWVVTTDAGVISGF